MLSKKEKKNLIELLDKYKEELNKKAVEAENIFKYEYILSLIEKIIIIRNKLYEPPIEIDRDYNIVDNILFEKQKYVIKHKKNPSIVVVPENINLNLNEIFNLKIIKSREIRTKEEIIVL